LRKVHFPEGSRRPGAWAGVNVVIEENRSVAVMTSQEKWDRLKAICTFWQGELKAGRNQLDFKKLQSDRGFLVYVTQAYPGMKPYLKGFHLSLEMWRGGRDAEGWKVNPGKVGETETRTDKEWGGMEAIKMGLLSQGILKSTPQVISKVLHPVRLERRPGLKGTWRHCYTLQEIPDQRYGG
jgi:hypothetical protein